MKKTIIILAIIITILSINKEEQVKIPKEAIRFRIIANSNTQEDQNIKKQIIKNLSSNIVNTNKLNSIEDTRKYLKKELPEFTSIVERTLNENSNNKVFHINYGKNYFPKKEYKNVIYPEGKYESLVITIGEGQGENFWCVLFPPLCLIDKDNQNVEYKSFVKEVLYKYF